MSRVAALYPNDTVTLREVGLRDGLQLVKTWPSTAAKRDWITREYDAGVRRFEVGSFLPAARFPQFADVGALIEQIDGLEGASSAALALNERGASDALETPLDEIVCVVSATEEHSQANARRSRADAVELIRTVVRLRDESANRPIVNAGIAMAFGCSIAGAVDPAEVLRLAEACLEAGADIVGIADTVGYAGPKQVGDLSAAMAKLCGGRAFIVHLHDTRGMGIANASAALDAGARVLDGSLGGLGGCPFAPGATGNVVFEDLVYLCETKGMRTGIDIERLTAVREILQSEMPGEHLYGSLVRAGPPPNLAWRP
ncbi:hydroxymethylglutaryl-CoA lyase [Microbaculum marinisediminis]|uniref:Hydroxymethylglutaryl-CoA lyase n=1 Tax=Microbaculum marinisediminis TaxID=2931392 RepID=A0AAW5R3A7_9HYPH|nr:hydroxymethylglutaryl-CoA lyase [Microbaculum sp. A6E488]MCT8974702.1 hydroxymethylglutaryl-CoA lyase [Microbaculum sp. A6E488]